MDTTPRLVLHLARRVDGRVTHVARLGPYATVRFCRVPDRGNVVVADAQVVLYGPSFNRYLLAEKRAGVPDVSWTEVEVEVAYARPRPSRRENPRTATTKGCPMANNYLTFSELLTGLTPKEAAWLRAALSPAGKRWPVEGEAWWAEPEDPDEVLRVDFQWSLDDTPNDAGTELWVYAEEYGSPGAVAELVRAFLARFRPRATWPLAYAEYCDSPRVGEFGGGAFFVTATSIKSISTDEWLTRMAKGKGA